MSYVLNIHEYFSLHYFSDRGCFSDNVVAPVFAPHCSRRSSLEGDAVGKMTDGETGENLNKDDDHDLDIQDDDGQGIDGLPDDDIIGRGYGGYWIYMWRFY